MEIKTCPIFPNEHSCTALSLRPHRLANGVVMVFTLTNEVVMI